MSSSRTLFHTKVMKRNNRKNNNRLALQKFFLTYKNNTNCNNFMEIFDGMKRIFVVLFLQTRNVYTTL